MDADRDFAAYASGRVAHAAESTGRAAAFSHAGRANWSRHDNYFAGNFMRGENLLQRAVRDALFPAAARHRSRRVFNFALRLPYDSRPRELRHRKWRVTRIHRRGA